MFYHVYIPSILCPAISYIITGISLFSTGKIGPLERIKLCVTP